MADMSHTPSMAAFLEQVERDQRQAEKKARRRLVVLGVLVLVVLGYMSWIYVQIADMDARSSVLVLKGYARTNLPQIKEELRVSLIAAAPDLTDQLRDAVARSPVFIRQQVETTVPLGSKALANEIELQLDAHLDTAVDGIVALSQQQGAKGGELTAKDLAENARAVYYGMIKTIVEDSYKDYSSHMSQFNSRLAHLHSGQWLSQKQQVQREIIEASLVLMDRYEVTDSVTPESVKGLTVPEVLEGLTSD